MKASRLFNIVLLIGAIAYSASLECNGLDKIDCLNKGCYWASFKSLCYDAPSVTGYRLSNLTNTAYGYEGRLDLVQGGNFYGTDITPLHISVWIETESRVRVKIFDTNSNRWEVPFVVQSPPPTNKPSTTDFSFSFTEFPFGFAVTRTSTNEVLFNTTTTSTPPSFNGLVFEDQYLEISSVLPNSANLYGLGEHIQPLKLDSRTYTMWNGDFTTPEYMNLYGTHPFYMDLRGDSGNAHGVFLLNSNGMDVVYSEGQSITYKVIGGVLDMYIFTGPTPDSVISQYTEVIGKPYMVAYWVLGFHQCRYGYHNISEVENVVANYKSHNISLETIWTDIDYMENYKDFTFDPIRFPVAQVSAFMNQLHNNNQHYVLMTDPGIAIQPGYNPYDVGMEMGIFIRNSSGSPFTGKVWPGLVHFPDFSNPAASEYWYQMISNFHETAPFDGLWIDMNEISNFCNGECSESNPRLTDQFSPVNPPYAINNMESRQPLDERTISMDAVHNLSIEYNLHNMFGYLESVATQQALEKVRGKRALVISRSTFPNSGAHAGHWTGDVSSSWSALALSIPDMLNFNLYGIPLVGADICGFLGDTTEELCARWIEVGAFYPFARDHNDINSTPQELYVWPLVANISREVLNIRYSLLPLYYTLFYEAHVGIGGTVVRPLFFEFPSDSATFAIDDQFLIGDSVMISPVVVQGVSTKQAYFPRGNWYDFYTLSPVSYSGQNVTLDAPIDYVPIHIRGGSILALQRPAYTIYQTRNNPFDLVVAMETTSGIANGTLYYDDGESLNSIQSNQFTYLTLNALYNVESGGKLYSSVLNNGFQPPATAVFASVSVLGVEQVQNVYLNGQQQTFSYDVETQLLFVENLSIELTDSFVLTWN